MKGKTALGALAGVALLTLSTGPVHAGAGGSPFPITSFLVCDAINGDPSGLTVDILGPFIGAPRTGVKIGNGALLCAVAKLFRSGTNNEIEPDPGGLYNTTGQMKCYGVIAPPKNSGNPKPPSNSITDQLFPGATATNGGTDTGVLDTGFKYICGPAQVTGP